MTMKKVLILFLCIVALAVLTACDNEVAETTVSLRPIEDYNDTNRLNPDSSDAPPEDLSPVPSPSDNPSIELTNNEPSESSMLSQDYPDAWEGDDLVSVEDFADYARAHNSPFVQDGDNAVWTRPLANGQDLVLSISHGWNSKREKAWGTELRVVGNGLDTQTTKANSGPEYTYSEDEKIMGGFLARKLWNTMALAAEVETDFEAKLALDCAYYMYEYKSIKDIPIEVFQTRYGTYEIPPWAK